MTVWSGIGVNYGHQAVYDTTVVESDFTFLRSAGVAQLRIAGPSYSDSTTIANCEDMVTRALSHGFYVVWGVTTSGTTTLTIWNALKSYVTGTLAPWAQSNGLSELMLGNEEEMRADGSTITAATMQSDIRSMVGTVKSGGYTGKVSYCTYTAQVANWHSGGLGSLDLIGINQYDVLANFTSNITTQVSDFTAAKTYVSEFGCITNGSSDYTNDVQYYLDVLARIQAMQSANVSKGYFFCYRDGGFGLPSNSFGLVKTDSSVHMARSAVLSAAAAATSFNRF